MGVGGSTKSYTYQPKTQYTGFGTEEDSMGSVKALVPKPPRKDEKKVFKCDMHVLRYVCKLVSTEPDDETRVFILSFFCGDDTISVYEQCDKNSGRMGGKFLERKTYKNPNTPHGRRTQSIAPTSTGRRVCNANWELLCMRAAWCG